MASLNSLLGEALARVEMKDVKRRCSYGIKRLGDGTESRDLVNLLDDLM